MTHLITPDTDAEIEVDADERYLSLEIFIRVNNSKGIAIESYKIFIIIPYDQARNTFNSFKSFCFDLASEVSSVGVIFDH